MDGHKQKTCFCKICEKGFGSEAKVREHHRKVHERKTKKVKITILINTKKTF